MRFEDRQPPDGWVVELVPDGRQSSDEQTICTALAAWILSRNDKRMRSGEIDQFYIQHKSLPRKKGWNDDLLWEHGLRRHIPKGDKSFFYIEAIPKSVTPKRIRQGPGRGRRQTERPRERSGTTLLLEDLWRHRRAAHRPRGGTERTFGGTAAAAGPSAGGAGVATAGARGGRRRRVAQAQSEEASLALARRLAAKWLPASAPSRVPVRELQPKQRAARQEEASASSSALIQSRPCTWLVGGRPFVSSHGRCLCVCRDGRCRL